MRLFSSLSPPLREFSSAFCVFVMLPEAAASGERFYMQAMQSEILRYAPGSTRVRHKQY
ncbi:MAG: hypothetical protein U0264_14725 [Candidatus Kapaibacterium sp.]